MKKKSRIQGDLRFRSVVLPNGIGIKAIKRNGFMSIETLGVSRTVKNGNVEVNQIQDLEPVKDYEDETRNVSKKIMIACGIMGVIWMVLWVINISKPYGVIFFPFAIWSLAVGMAPRTMAHFILRTFKKGDYLSMSQYTGALYQVANAYYDLMRVPQMDELKNYSRYLIYDKFFKEICRAIPFVLAGIASFSTGIGYIILIVLLLAILLILQKTDLIYNVEALVVSKPTEEQLAIVLNTVDDAISYIDGVNIVNAGDGDTYKVSIRMDIVDGNPISKEVCEKCPNKEECGVYQEMKEAEC